jgi:RES domain-containing protein
MRIWRISNYADLSGIGGLKVAGRWHEKGRQVVYAAEHPSTALLEVLVHLEIDAEDIPDNFQIIEINVPAALPIASIEESELENLSPAWKDDVRISRGQALPWFRELKTPIIRVPSAILSGVSNFLINPLHPEAPKITVVDVKKHPYDTRLFAQPAPAPKIT